MGSSRNSKNKKRTKKNHGRRNDGVAANNKSTKATPTGTSTATSNTAKIWTKTVSTVSASLLVICAAVAYNHYFHRHSFAPAAPTETKRPKVFDEARYAAMEAMEDPVSVPKAQSASQAFFLEGRVSDASKWTAETLRRRALQAGATPQQAWDTKRFELIHLLLHLEVNVIMMSRLLLQVGYRLALQIETECNSSTPGTLSASLQADPTTLPRGLVADVVADCLLKDKIFETHLTHPSSDSTPSSTSYGRSEANDQLDRLNGWTAWHLVAHFGNPKLVAAALQAARQPEFADLTTAVDPFGRTPSDIATLRGFPATAKLFLPENQEPRAPPKPIKSKLQHDRIVDYGGWDLATTGSTGRGDSMPPVAADCSIPVEHNMTVEKLYTYVAAELPVLVRQGYNPSTYPPLRQLLSKDKFVDKFGAMMVKVGAVPYQGTLAMTVKDFIDRLDKDFDMDDEQPAENSAPDYLFESLPAGHPLRNLIEQHYPEWAGYSVPQERQVQLAIGGKGTGAPPHYHKAAVNTLFYGRKKWFLMPPTSTVYTSQSAQEWFSRRQDDPERRHSSVLECVQQPGDLIFVPDFWGHATLNLEPSVAVASEFMTPRMVFDMVL